MNQEETEKTGPEKTTPVDEKEVSDTELENISGGVARTRVWSSCYPNDPGDCG